jgi:hypothetical protein
MTLEEVFKLVTKGEQSDRDRLGWACPACNYLLEGCASRDDRDRRALRHCLFHALPTTPAAETARRRATGMAPPAGSQAAFRADSLPGSPAGGVPLQLLSAVSAVG